MTAPSRVERFLAHLDQLSGGVEPRFSPVESTKPGLPRVMAIGYRDMPEAGMTLGFTYGLSLAEHDEWRGAKPELSLLMRSSDPTWAVAAALVAEPLRGDCAFGYADTINLGSPVAADTAMDGFVVWGPAALEPEDACVDVGEDRPIHVVGLWPTYGSERRFIQQRGVEEFWRLDWDPYDPQRAPAV